MYMYTCEPRTIKKGSKVAILLETPLNQRL